MKTLTSTAVLMILVAASAMAGEAKWWTYEYDGSVNPNAADPAWVGNTGDAVQTEGSTVFWHTGGSNRYDGYTINPATFDTFTGPWTAEYRVRLFGTGGGDNSAGQGALWVDKQSMSHFLILHDDYSTDHDIADFGWGGAPNPTRTIDEEWNVFRVVYNGHGTDVYLLSGGELYDEDHAWWTPTTLVPSLDTWSGYGTGNSWMKFNGALDVDYIRFAPGAFAPEGVPEPTTLGLFVLGGVAGLLRRRRG